MSRRKQRSAFDQVSEFDRGRIVAYRDRGLSFREIGSSVGRNQTTVKRICSRLKQKGAVVPTRRATIDLFKDTFGDRLISRFGPVNWPPRSCDLTPLDYFLWGYVKSLVYADKPQTLDHLEDNIRRVIADIRPQMLEKVIENWTSRLDYIRASRGSPMPEIIFKMAVGSLVVRASDSRREGLGSMPDATKHPPSTHGFTCRNCGGGDRGRIAIYRPFGELHRAKIVLSPVWCSRPTTGVPLAHATMNFVGLDLTASDRWHQKTTTTIINLTILSQGQV
ncbi:hypothetical protein TNCV_1309171 [Trichonephila clavipes]|nr:hypothetical protein TNCV_1309171 [Trichonephila clavipes]